MDGRRLFPRRGIPNRRPLRRPAAVGEIGPQTPLDAAGGKAGGELERVSWQLLTPQLELWDLSRVTAADSFQAFAEAKDEAQPA